MTNTATNTAFDKIFRDSSGEIVIAQIPNLPLIVWIVATLSKLLLSQLFLTTGKITTGLDLLAFGSLFTWAWLELFQGVNYFRRILGFCVLIATIALRI